MDQVKAAAVMTILELILTGLGALIATYLLPKLPALTKTGLDWLKSRAASSKSEYLNGVLRRFIDLLGAGVLAAENTLIQELKDAAADGKITKSELILALEKVKQQVIDDAKAQASAQGIWDVIQKVAFEKNEAALSQWVDDHVEALVAKLPPSGLQTSATLNGKSALELGVPPAHLSETLKDPMPAVPLTAST